MAGREHPAVLRRDARGVDDDRDVRRAGHIWHTAVADSHRRRDLERFVRETTSREHYALLQTGCLRRRALLHIIIKFRKRLALAGGVGEAGRLRFYPKHSKGCRFECVLHK